MADLYSILPGLDPNGQDILEAELLIKQVLEAKYPDLDLREGTGVRDLVLRPTSFALALAKKGYDSYFSQNLLGGMDDDTPTELVDGVLSNLFLTRNTGTFSVINARLYFAREKSVTLSTNTSFSPNGTLLFFPATSLSFPASAMQFDAFQNEWYIDVDLVAAQRGSEYNLSSGSLLYFSNFDPFFLHGEINNLSQISSDAETNLQFIARAKDAISTRNLINAPSISSRLKSEFNFIPRIRTIGASDPEMFRDLLPIAGQTFPAVLSNSTSLTDGGTKLLIEKVNHGYIVGQKLNVREVGSAIVLTNTPVTNVIDANNFKVALGYTLTPSRAIARVYIEELWEPTYVHSGGKVDIHCSSSVIDELVQYTTNAQGKCTITGPIFKLTRSGTPGGEFADTIPINQSYTLSHPDWTSRTDVTITQDSSNNILVKLDNGFPIPVGRLIHIQGWPTAASNLYLPVREIVDEWSAYVGNTATDYTVDPGLAPQINFVHAPKDFGFSTYQTMTLDFGVAQANKTASFVTSSFQYLGSIQSYLELEDNRVVCGDYLARGFDVYVVNFNLIVYDNFTVTSGQAADIVTSYFNSLEPGQDLILSEVIAALTSQGLSGLRTPIGVSYALYTKDLFPASTVALVDKIQPLNSSSVYILGSMIVTPQAL